MEIRSIRTEGLGDATYVLLHDGLAIVVDPQRDIDRFETVLEEANSDLRFVLETHLHNDYLSGGLHLARKNGGELVMPAGAAPVFAHTPAFHREDLVIGDLAIRPLHTPGHTPEHVSYLILVDGRPVAVFSGGCLLVGSAGRTDLLGPERAETLARLQFVSVNRLASLDDKVALYPTHGAGSFCTTSVAGGHTSTIGVEKRTNPVLSHDDPDSFVAAQLSGLVAFPAYYRHMGPANLAGVDPIKDLTARTLSRDDFEALEEKALLVDTRPDAKFARGHIPGSLNIPLGTGFGTWVGWLLPHGEPLVLVMEKDQDREDAIRQLSRIGFDDVLGVIDDLDDWQGELASYSVGGLEDLVAAVRDDAQVLDVRAPGEWETGTLPGSVLRYTPDVFEWIPDEIDKNRKVWVVCGSGYRAAIAASHLESEGYDPVLVTGTGVTDALRSLSKH